MQTASVTGKLPRIWSYRDFCVIGGLFARHWREEQKEKEPARRHCIPVRERGIMIQKHLCANGLCGGEINASSKRMAIRYARRLDFRISDLKSHQRMKWWSTFRRRRWTTTRRVTGLLKGGIEKVLEKLCVRYRANIHAHLRSGQYKWLCNGYHTSVSCEPKGTHTLAEVGERFVRICVNGKWREHITLYLHYAVRIEKGVDADGDPALVFKEARRLTPCIVWRGKPEGRVHIEVRQIQKQYLRQIGFLWL